VAPVLPGTTDDIAQLDTLFAAAKRAGARFIHAGPLRLYPAIRDRFCRSWENTFRTWCEVQPSVCGTWIRAARLLEGAVPSHREAPQETRVQNQSAMFDRYRPAKLPVQGELELRGSLP